MRAESACRRVRISLRIGVREPVLVLVNVRLSAVLFLTFHLLPPLLTPRLTPRLTARDAGELHGKAMHWQGLLLAQPIIILIVYLLRSTR